MHKRRLTTAVVFVLVTGLPATGWAATTPKSKTTKAPTSASSAKKAAKAERVAELREQIGEASEREGALLDEIETIQEKLDGLNATVRKFDREAAAAKRLFDKAERSLAKAESERAAVAQRLAEAKAAVEGARLAMNVTVTALYQRGQSQDQAVYAAIVTSSQSPHEILAAARYLKGQLLDDRADFDRFVELQNEVAVLDAEAESKRILARAARDELAVERNRLEGLRGEAVAARAAARAEEDRREDLLAEVQERKADFERELSALQAESSAIGVWLRELQSGQKLAPRKKKTFRLPVNAPMSSQFGPRVHPVYGDVRVHTGLDFSANSGLPIKAAGPGLVVWAAPRGGYGNLTVVDHGNGLATLYAHQSRQDATIGQRVAAGQVLGAVGSTGLSTGPHLHFEVREFGNPVDPRSYL